MQNNKTYHDLSGQLASLAEGLKLLQENLNMDFRTNIIKLMEKKCSDLKESLKALDQMAAHE